MLKADFDKKILLYGHYKCSDNESDRYTCKGPHTCKFIFKKGTVKDYRLDTLPQKTILNWYQPACLK